MKSKGNKFKSLFFNLHHLFKIFILESNLLIMSTNIYMSIAILTITHTLCLLCYVIFSKLLYASIISTLIYTLRQKWLSNLFKVPRLIIGEATPTFVPLPLQYTALTKAMPTKSSTVIIQCHIWQVL